MRTFILTKAYSMQLGNSKSNDEKAKYLLELVEEFDKRQEEKESKNRKINVVMKYSTMTKKQSK